MSYNNSGKAITVPHFDPRQMADDARILMLGKTGMGKTKMIKEIMFWKRHIPDGICISSTEEANNEFSGWVPDLFIFDKFDPTPLERTIKRAKKLNKRRFRMGLPKKYTFVIIDDYAYDSKVMNHPLVKQILFTGRQYGIFFIVSLQYLRRCMDPSQRTQIDYIFVFQEFAPKNRRAIQEDFCGIVDERDFNKILDTSTRDYKVLVIKNTGRMDPDKDLISQRLFWFKARLFDRPIKIGSRAFWKYHYEHFDEDYDKSDDEEDENHTDITYAVRKRNPSKVKLQGGD